MAKTGSLPEVERTVENDIARAQDTLVYYFRLAGVDTTDNDVETEIRGIVDDIFNAARYQIGTDRRRALVREGVIK